MTIKYIYKRLLHLIPILFGITLVNFGLMYLAPGDPAERALSSVGIVVSEEVLAAKREQMGLNQPFVRQYLRWMKGLMTGDLGTSYSTGRPVWKELSECLPYTLALTAGAMSATIVISVPLGLWAAVRQNSWLDYLVRLISFIGASVPGFLLALLLIYVFALKLRVLPVIGGQGLKGLILPTATLATGMSAKYIRQVRAAVLDELGKGYVLGARARGVKEKLILYRNVLKNALLTIVTLIGLSIGYLLGGTAVVEIIHMWPGLGKLVIDAIGQRDYPVVQGYVVWMAAIFVSVNLLTDLSYRLLDPKVRLSREVA